jgi:uncharacterized membrane protein
MTSEPVVLSVSERKRLFRFDVVLAALTVILAGIGYLLAASGFSKVFDIAWAEGGPGWLYTAIILVLFGLSAEVICFLFSRKYATLEGKKAFFVVMASTIPTAYVLMLAVGALNSLWGNEIPATMSYGGSLSATAGFVFAIIHMNEIPTYFATAKQSRAAVSQNADSSVVKDA